MAKLRECIAASTAKKCGNESFPILSITMKDGIVLQSDKFKKRIASADTSTYICVPYGKLVQGIHIDEGNFGVQDIVPMGIVSPAYKLWDINEDVVLPKYIEMVLRSPKCIEYYKAKLTGTVNRRGRMSATDFLDMDIPLPNKEKQYQIVENMNKLNQLITMRKEQLAKLNQLVKSRFIELFGDYRINEKGFDCKKGSELFKFSSGKFLPEEKRLDEGIPVYGGNGIAWYTSESLVDYPTIIIGRVGAQCGNIHAVTTPVWITDNAIYIKEQKTNAYTLEFLTELMRMMDFYQYADFSGQPKITQKPLETLNYIMPPIELQNEYTAFVEQTDKSKLAIQQSLDKLELLKKSLMQEYFG